MTSVLSLSGCRGHGEPLTGSKPEPHPSDKPHDPLTPGARGPPPAPADENAGSGPPSPARGEGRRFKPTLHLPQEVRATLALATGGREFR